MLSPQRAIILCHSLFADPAENGGTENIELELDRLPELAGFVAMQALLLVQEEEAVTTLLQSSSLSFAEACQDLGSLRWGCSGTASSLPMHLPLLAWESLQPWVNVRELQGWCNELLFCFVRFWLDHVSELAAPWVGEE